jgi:phosphodiesterase/alkaline phosphatase D-like protein
MRIGHARTGWLRAVPLLLTLLLGACSSDNPTGSGDTTAPAAITDLALGAVTTNSVVLTWTAPGDDGTTGTAAQYDIRYSTSAIMEGNFASAPRFTGAPNPTAPGTQQQVTVTGLSPNTPYHFSMKTRDEASNGSALSNVVQATTAPLSTDTTPPAAITELEHGTESSNSIVLTWTAPGDDGTTGTATQYDIRYSTAPITEGNFAAATQFAGAPAPAAPGTPQQVTVTGLVPNTPYYFAMKTSDEVPNWSAISNVVQATTEQSADQTAPAAVTDLSASPLDANSVALTWTATGDDGNTGTAQEYDVRYSTSVISNANWASATQATGEPAPDVAGTVQHFTVTGLLPDQDYHFALKTRDEIPNESTLSNVPTAHTPSGQVSPPGLLVPDFPDTVCISSTDTYAQYAKLIAQSQLGLVNAYASLAAAFFNPLGGADWQHTGNCWTWDYGFGGCSVHYESCGTGTEYTYGMTYNGSCSGQNLDNWTAYRVVADNAARTATFYAYELNSTTIQMAWTWTWAADENSGTYTFYEGDPATAPVLSTIEWSRSADHNVFDTTYIVPGQSKTVSHAVKVPCSGWVHTYQWDAVGGWWMDNDIVWNADQSGYWDVYDDTGAQLEHHLW